MTIMTTHAAPELWMPADIEDRGPALRRTIRKRTKPIDAAHTHWRDYVAANLHAHVNEYLAATGRRGEQAPAPGRIVPDGHLHDQGRMTMTFDDANKRAVVSMPRTAAHDFTDEIQQDAARCWDAYLTLLTVERARDERAQEERSEAERETRRLNTCPYCESVTGAAHYGPFGLVVAVKVAARLLIEGSATSPKVRACQECHELAKVVYLDELGKTRTNNGKTRAAAIAADLRAGRGLLG